jgi:UTP-glucose-1-phosphate uridylyltransferase
MAAAKELTATVHTIVRTPMSQYYVNQAVKSGMERPQVQPGSVSFLQRFGRSLNLMMSS